jgi:hypothetical protein
MFNWLLDLFKPKTSAYYELPSPKPRFTQAQAEEVVRFMVDTTMLKQGSWASTVEDTGSEDPFIDKGNFVIFEPTDTLDLIVGDLATYWKDATTLALHRIVKISGDWFTFHGDNPKITVDDAPVHRSQIREVIRGVLY